MTADGTDLKIFSKEELGRIYHAWELTPELLQKFYDTIQNDKGGEHLFFEEDTLNTWADVDEVNVPDDLSPTEKLLIHLTRGSRKRKDKGKAVDKGKGKEIGMAGDSRSSVTLHDKGEEDDKKGGSDDDGTTSKASSERPAETNFALPKQLEPIVEDLEIDLDIGPLQNLPAFETFPPWEYISGWTHQASEGQQDGMQIDEYLVTDMSMEIAISRQDVDMGFDIGWYAEEDVTMADAQSIMMANEPWDVAENPEDDAEKWKTVSNKLDILLGLSTDVDSDVKTETQTASEVTWGSDIDGLNMPPISKPLVYNNFIPPTAFSAPAVPAQVEHQFDVESQPTETVVKPLDLASTPVVERTTFPQYAISTNVAGGLASIAIPLAAAINNSVQEGVPGWWNGFNHHTGNRETVAAINPFRYNALDESPSSSMQTIASDWLPYLRGEAKSFEESVNRPRVPRPGDICDLQPFRTRGRGYHR